MRLFGLFYAVDLCFVLESEEDLSVMVGRLVEIYERRGLKFNADRSKLIALIVEKISLF